MASKQLGKLRQWGREVISTKEKTVLTEEFKALEQDVDLRRAGIERLHETCTEYHGYLHKKKEYPSVEPDVKMLPVDAMGAVMMSHGEEFGEDSAFGQCLLKFGRAHCKIATLQESYALTFRDTYLTDLASALEELKDYAAQRKKLDSRRLAYDAAMTRSAKAKKEKEVKEAEEELSKAKLRYEETSTDVQTRMHAIQEKEIEQLRELTEFLAVETRFVEQYLDVLRDTRREWLDESSVQLSEPARRKVSAHAFAFGRSTPSISSISKTSTSAGPPSVSTAGTTPSDERGDEEDYVNVGKGRASPSTSRPSSRGSTRSAGTAHTGRRRRDSAGASSDGGGSGTVGKRTGVAGWAAGAVSSLGRSKKDTKKEKVPAKQRDKDATRAFASLENDGDESSEDADRPEEESRAFSRALAASIRQMANPPDTSSSSSFNSGSASSVPPKIVRALRDYTGSSDELSFRTGDQIVVVSEAKDGWVIGELTGRRGLLPADYTEEVISPRTPSRTMTDIAKRAQDETMSEDSMSIVSADGQHIRVYDEPFGDHHLAKSPLVADHEPATDEEDEKQGLFPQRSPTSVRAAPQVTSPERLEVGNVTGKRLPTMRPRPPPPPPRKPVERKPPPPPPPPPLARRSTINSSIPPLHTTGAGGPYVSAPASTSNLPAASFPSPPAAPRRTAPRTRSSHSISTFTPPASSTSPFDN